MTHGHGTVTAVLEVPPTDDTQNFQLVVVELEPGQYTEIRIAATPQLRQPGRVLLHGYRIYSLER